MMKEEFEKIAGYEVSFKDYNDIIEPMYMATNLTKDEFVKTINKKRFAIKPTNQIVNDMKGIAEDIKDTCTHYHDTEAREKLDNLVEEYIKRIGYEDIARYQIEEQQIQSCYYPKRLIIYLKNNFETIKDINLAE